MGQRYILRVECPGSPIRRRITPSVPSFNFGPRYRPLRSEWNCSTCPTASGPARSGLLCPSHGGRRWLKIDSVNREEKGEGLDRDREGICRSRRVRLEDLPAELGPTPIRSHSPTCTTRSRPPDLLRAGFRVAIDHPEP